MAFKETCKMLFWVTVTTFVLVNLSTGILYVTIWLWTGSPP